MDGGNRDPAGNMKIPEEDPMKITTVDGNEGVISSVKLYKL